MRVVGQFFDLIGPIIISALSIFIAFIILQPLACWLDPIFNLLASRGIGKIAFVSLVIYQILLLLLLQPKAFLQQFLKTNLYFFTEKNWLKKFFSYFLIFFLFHVLILLFFLFFGFVQYNSNWGNLNISLVLRIFWGFIATFFLAWTEELIFRGTLYPFFAQKVSPLISLLTTSLIFMFVHDLRNPLNLITKNWELGLGLFLLGALLNIIFISTKKLYTNMGAHAGLVFVKVILRRAPLIIFLPPSFLPFWINKDLRMAPIVHVLFFLAIMILAIKNRKKLFKSSAQSESHNH